jgi:hypothetical protein
MARGGNPVKAAGRVRGPKVRASKAAAPRGKSVTNPSGLSAGAKKGPSAVARAPKAMVASEQTPVRPMPRVPAQKQPK